MPFNNTLPEWNKTATAPTQTKKDNGWSAGEKPPASIFDWFFNTTYKALQELQQEAINSDQKGATNGVAPLDGTGKVPSANLPNGFVNVSGKTGGTLTTVVPESSTDTLVIEGQGLIQVTTDAATDTIILNTTAEVNQNAFSAINANGVSITADSKSDTFGVFQGPGITVSGFGASNSFTISNDLLTDTGIFNAPNQSYVHLNSTGTQSIASQTDTKITILTTEIYDYQGEASAARFTAKETGNYLVRMSVDWGASNIPVAEDSLKIYKNGSYYGWLTADSAARYLDGLIMLRLNATDYIEFYVYQSSGSTAKVLQSANVLVAKIS